MTPSLPRGAWALIVATLALQACSPKPDATAPAATAASSPAPSAPAALAQSSGPVASAEEARLSGKHDLWQDGEGGLVCHVMLETTPTIGGHVIQADTDCDRKLKLGGDPFAWFLDPAGVLVIVDPARRPLLHLKRLDDGSYKDRRDGDYVNAILLTRR